jgi:hypothetical protein
MKSARNILQIIVMAAACGACIEPYDPPVDAADVNLLVVDGFLDASTGTIQVVLTRTLPVKSPENIPVVSGATVRLENEDGGPVTLLHKGEGMYAAEALDINYQTRYRLVITTTENSEYASEFVEVTQAPPIDSISYYRKSDGVEFAVHSHDPAGIARYFRWEYEETYEYNAEYNSSVMFEGDEVIARPPELSMYTCWKTNPSTSILLGTTRHLTESIVNRAPVIYVPGGSVKLGIAYSLLVKQQVLTEGAYNYWLNLQKNTENLGGLFDPLPSEIKGNLYNTTDPREKVIGYFSGGTVQESRIFVKRGQLPKGITGYSGTNSSCTLDSLLLDELAAVNKESTYLVEAIMPPGATLLGYFATSKSCVDCRSKGGTTAKPDFWE